jgi:hypothetical protein
VSLAYCTVKRGDTIGIEWLGESQHTADDLLSSAPSSSDDDSRLAEARYVLFSILSLNGGRLPATQVKKAAQKALVAEGTLKRAKKKLKVRSRKKLFAIPFPPEEDDDSDDDQEPQPAIQTDPEPKLTWFWILPTDEEDLLRPYRERFERERAEDLAEQGAANAVTKNEDISGVSVSQTTCLRTE